GEDLGDLAEIGRPEHGRGRDRQERRVDVTVVLKAVDLPAPHAHRLARPNIDDLAVDRPGRGALEPVDRLLEAVVTVGNGHARAGWDVALERRRGPVRVGGLDQEAHAERTDRDRVVVHGAVHAGSLREKRFIESSDLTNVYLTRMSLSSDFTQAD